MNDFIRFCISAVWVIGSISLVMIALILPILLALLINPLYIILLLLAFPAGYLAIKSIDMNVDWSYRND